MKIRTLFANLILCSHLIVSSTFATSVVDLTKTVSDTVIVPYDSSKPVAGQKPTQLYVPYGRFLELWEKAKLNRAGAQSLPAGTPFVLSSARYEGRLENRRVVFTATIDLATFDNPWVKVPLGFKGVNIGSLTLDGKPAVFAGDSIVVEKPGNHVVVAQFEIPLPKGSFAFQWGVPRTTATRLKLNLPEIRWTAKVQPDCAVVEQVDGTSKLILAALGTVDEIRVRVVESAAAARLVEPASAKVETTVVSHPSFESVQSLLQYEFPGGQQERLTVSFEKNLDLISVDAPDMKSWQITEANDRQTLEVSLNKPVKSRINLILQLERPANPGGHIAPTIRPGANRLSVTTALFSAAGVEVKPQPSSELRQAEVITCHEPNAVSQGAWTGEGALKYTTAVATTKHEATVDTVYQVNRRKIELVSSFQLLAKDSPLFDVSLTLPEHFEVQGVESVRLQDWWLESGKLHVRFKGITPEMTPLVVYLVRLYDTAPQQLAVQPVVLDGFVKVSGEAIIAAHKGVDTTLKLTSENNAAKEIDPAKAATSFDILPPLERKRGFVFKTQSFTGEVALTAVPAKADATWMLHAQAHETWASLSMKTEITLRQGSMDQTTFTLPATFPEARVSGSEVRETRSRVEGDVRIYEVAFQNDIHEAVDFTVELDVPMKENATAARGAKVNELTLPTPTFPGAQIVTGYVLADNASDSEMKLLSEGTDRVAATTLPWIPALSKSAGIFRVQPKWKLSLTIERLEKAESRAAFCAWADMTTALRSDGTEWHKAVWHLQNRSLQFLPVKLPEGAELMSVRVAEQNVRADSGTVNGQAAILVPLIKTRPGDISFDVEMVWRRIGKAPDKKDERKFDDAELLGITVEQTFWNVWLPENRTLTKAEGNMEEVVEALKQVEKSSSLLDELKSLNKMLSSAVGSKDRKRAQATFTEKSAVLNKDLRRQATRQLEDIRSSKPEAKDEKQAVAKLKEAQQKVNELEIELNKQLAYNKKLEAEAPQQDAYYRGEGASSAELDGRFAGSAVRQPIIGKDKYNQAATRHIEEIDRKRDDTAVIDGFEPKEFPDSLNNRSELTPQSRGRVRTQSKESSVEDIGGDRWEKQTAPAKKPAKIVSTQEGKRQLLVNDNIVLNQKAEPEPEAKPLSITAEESVSGDSLSLTDLERRDTNKNLTQAWSSARGNVVQQKATAVYSHDSKSDADANGWKNNAKGSYRLVPTPAKQLPHDYPTPSNPVIAATASAPAFPAAAPLAAPDEADEIRDRETASLQTAGRISLAMDFPLEGKVYHFKKVKANAALAIAFADSKPGHGLRNTGLFCLLALALWALGNWRERRLT